MLIFIASAALLCWVSWLYYKHVILPVKNEQLINFNENANALTSIGNISPKLNHNGSGQSVLIMNDEKQFIENYEAKGWTLKVYTNWKYLSKGMEGIGIYPDGSIGYSSPAGSWKYATVQDWFDKKPSSVKEYGNLD
jgi:hypothetical protein